MDLQILQLLWRPFCEGYRSQFPLRLVISISEAHNIFSQTGKARPSEEAANPLAYVVALIKQLMVELRALGVGIILSDQHPSELDPSAVKSIGTKITCKEIHGDDRDMLAVSMLLPEFQAEDLARLKPGEAYILKEGFYRPIRIKMYLSWRDVWT